MKNGFTLLELSIVIAIIGLIVGGLVVGKDLIRSAQLNGVLSDVIKYKTAMDTFKLKYESLPGDMPDASQYWSDCVDLAPSTLYHKCDGDGNTIIGTGNLGFSGDYERYRAWQHLSLSGIIPENLDSIQGGSGGFFPISPIDGNWTIMYRDSNSGIGNGPLLQRESNFLALFESAFNDCNEYYLLDVKSDDGIAYEGDTLSLQVAADSACLDDATYDYIVSETDMDDAGNLAFKFR